MTVESLVVFEKIDTHVGLLTLRRPQRLNALSFTAVKQLQALLDRLMDDIDTRVVILTGAGKGFCAGADLKAQVSGEQGAWDASKGRIQSDYLMQQAYASITAKLRRIPQPLIAAVNGVAAGAGFSLALACDVRIASPRARFNCAFTSIGLGGGDVGSSYFLPKILGSSLAAELMYSGRFIEADEALATGLVSRVCDDQSLLESAIEMARQFVTNTSPFGLRITKETINHVSEGMSLEQVLQLENRNQVMALQTADFSESVSAWTRNEKHVYTDH